MAVDTPAAAAPTSVQVETPRRRGRSVEGRPRVAVAFTVLFFVVLYLPIVVVVLFSFNSKKSLSSFGGFSTRWYEQFFDDAALQASLRASLLISFVSMIGAVVLGTMLALALERVTSRKARAVGVVALVPLVTPEIVTGVAALLFFTGLGVKLSLTTVIIAEITFSIAYVAVIVRGRLSAMSEEVEEAARDLGCTPWQSLRLVIVPTILPALIASGLLVFALVFDDFVLAFFTTGVDPQPLPVRIYSQIRLAISPAINAVGTIMLAVSVLLITLSLVVPRLFGRKDSGLDLISGG
jgi:spermidine/putrescine transport system permease protein/putrescine transport system permease protein